MSDMTERLYYNDAYLRDFTARVIETAPDGLTVFLDRSAFYPTSGGQPFDTGSIAGAVVTDVFEDGDRVAHRLLAPLAAGGVACHVDWDRRFDHMQQHSGQHLLSAIFEELHRLRTVSFHLGAESSTIDLEGAAVDSRMVEEVERRANAVVFENRPIGIAFQDATEVTGLRKPSDREGALRIVSIEGLDKSACGGTHVRATGEIGPILVRKTEKVRQSTRVEFLCGGRAVRRARADYNALAQAAQLFSAPLDDVPGLVAAQLEAGRSADKARRKLEIELAGYQGRDLYRATGPAADGARRVLRQAERGNLEELRAIAQSFTEQGNAVFVATLADPPSVLLAASADSGVDAGRLLKAALSEMGGRGGGTARMAQGSAPNPAALQRVVEKLLP